MTRRKRLVLDDQAIARLARLVAERAGERQLALFAPIGARGAEWGRACVVDAESGEALHLSEPANEASGEKLQAIGDEEQ